MTVKRAMELFCEERQNSVSEELLMFWLSQLDMKIFCELLKNRGMDEFKGYVLSSDKGKTLLAPEEYCEIYTAYLTMQTDRINGETIRFNNSAQIFNRLYYELSCYISRSTPVKKRAEIKAVTDYV